jgi:hypothetical protein
VAISAQDKYTVQVPNGLALAECRGYESWQLISISQNGPVVAAIMGNPAMIQAFQAGIPANGKPVPTAPGWQKSTGARRSRRRTRSAAGSGPAGQRRLHVEG